MANAKDLLDAGQLSAAIKELTQEVKLSPANISSRVFLFEVLCFAGEWDRAERQLDVIGSEGMQTHLGVQAYVNNIKAERARQQLFSAGLHPHFLAEPPAYIDLHLAAINRLREGGSSEARELLDRAEEERPALPGKLNGNQFLDFRDYNDLTGPVVELIVHDKYTWLPLEQIKRLEVAVPKQLRDLLWPSARIESYDGTIGQVYMPALYPDSSRHPNDQVKLGRLTDWNQMGENVLVPVGLRQFLVDDEDKPIFEARTVEFDSVVG